MTTTDDLRSKVAAKKAELVPANGDGPVPVAEVVPFVAPVPEPVAPPKVLGGLPHLRTYMQMAEAICRTEMVPQVLRNRPDAILAVVLAGAELGVGPMQSLQGIDLIQGRPSVSPELMRALITQAGHKFRLDQTDTAATVTCRRRTWGPDEPDAVFVWTMDDARRAQLAGKENFKKFPRAMLSARASSEAARAIFADVVAGLSYTPEEAEFFTPATANLSAPGEITLAEVDEARQEATEPEVDTETGEILDEAALDALAAAEFDQPAAEDPWPPFTEADETLRVPEVPTEPLAEPVTERKDMLRGLGEVIGALPPLHQKVIRPYLRKRYGSPLSMTAEQVNEACAIAAGWPTTAGDPAPPVPTLPPEPEPLW